MFKQIHTVRAFEQVVEQIQEAIYNGQLPLGDHLPAERELVEQFGVSRATMREALRSLESMGLLKTQPGNRKGPQISSSNVTALRRILEGTVRLEKTSLVDLVQYRMIIGSAQNSLAANLASEDQLAHMRDAIAGMKNVATDDPIVFAQHDMNFHTAVSDAAGNAFLKIVGTVVNEIIVDLISGNIQDSTDSRQQRADFIQWHEKIYSAIECGDSAQAASLAQHSLFEVYGPLLNENERNRLNLLLS